MSRIGLGRGRGGLALSAAGALWLGCAGQPAIAGDDGAAPIWTSLGSVFHFGDDKVQPDIDYRDHPRLVVPPKIELPPPAAAPSAGASDWPRDPDVERFKKLKAEEEPRTPYVPARINRYPSLYKSDTVTTPYTSGLGPSEHKCTAGPGGSCDTAKPSAAINWNPLTWIGVEKKPQIVLGPEPQRDSLTDPPPGYRAPAEGVGVKIDNN
jgi:hypothetical protein